MSFALGEAIRQSRVRKGMTLRALARAVDVSAPFMSDLEHGRRNTDKLPKIAKVLGVSLDELRVLESRVDADLKKWIEQNPGLVALLRACSKRKSPCTISVRNKKVRVQ